MQKYRTDQWKTHLVGHWDHRQNTHILWKTINGVTRKKSPPNTNATIQFNNYTAITPKQRVNEFTKQFTNIVKHRTNPKYRKINRLTQKLKSQPITITTEQTKTTIKQMKNNNFTVPDGINIKHLKHLRPTALSYLTKLLNMSLNSNIIPQIWKKA